MINKKIVIKPVKVLSKKGTAFVLAVLMGMTLTAPAYTYVNAANMFENSDFIEIEQPEINEETKKLISLYQRNPSEENYNNLRNQVIANYDAVLAKKEAKLAELRAETDGKPGGEAKVAEMEEIVQEMYVTYWDRINNNMLRFSDTRLLKWNVSKASEYDYIPVMGAGENIYIKYTPVTNAEYAEYIMATGASTPDNWINGMYPQGEDNLPVNYVSYEAAKGYCEWLTDKDANNTYRLPDENEWELAAGHMPKDADFNCGVEEGRTPVDKYQGITRGAHGAIDFWGNVWEWISTKRSLDADCTVYGIKGGSYESERTDCRTENKEAGRNGAAGYEDVGFRVVQVMNYKDNEIQDNSSDELYKDENETDNTYNNGDSKNDYGYISSIDYSYNNNRLTITWDSLAETDTYYVYKYNPETKRISNPRVIMGNTSYTYHRAVANATYFFVITTDKINTRYLYNDADILTISVK